MRKSCAALIPLFWSLVATASGADFLSKAQVAEALAGKTFTFTRATDGNLIRWDFKSDGEIYANNRSSAKKDSGTWTVQNDGLVCIKWRGSSNDNCNSYFVDDAKLMRAGGRSAQALGKAVPMTPD